MEALVAARRQRAGRLASGGHLEPLRTSIPSEGPKQSWVTQWQDLLKEMDSTFSEGGEPQQTELRDNPKAFLASFEQVAKACQWPREEWAARLLPALCGEAQAALRGLEAGDREDYGKVKAAILQGEAHRVEAQRRHFRHFRYQGTEDPRRVYSHLWELCYQWLKPERRTKEQILELLILEQFLAILPAEVKAWVAARDLEGGVQRVALTEEFLRTYQEATAGEKQNYAF
ncbi:SCAN domain-containing protein 3-like [Python bivittatus]|uniref:SCAN domain-containing protein 3-like n=1 Tax=Python bivittatus TaxID=176946 RepID=A0A9F5ISZ8_PYTBI|nr:SCAN domain-containing protein 3-like [Python bivittatus]